MKWNFNVLERRAGEMLEGGKASEAIRIYFLMADGDPSLDGGHLGRQIALCYEQLGQPYAAKYWHGRAFEESGGVRENSANDRKRLEGVVNIDDLISPSEYVIQE